ncbi:T9SS type A sorting domain-containing protein [Niastella populi]|nr:T9SS type A sorting domain-containing protein [Niastella populi]
MYPVPGKRPFRIVMLFICFILFSIPYAQAQCIASGPNSPASSASVPYSGSDYSFSNPTNALANDNNVSTAASVLSLFNQQTDYLQVKNFGFNIPTGASICGIEVHVVKSADNVLLNLASVTDYNVRIIKNNSLTGPNMADPAQWSASDTYITYGGVNDLWGTSWSPSDINSNNFGFSIAGEIITTVSLFPTARIDQISITVHYLDPTVLSAQAIQFNVVNASNRSALLSWKQSTEETTSYVVERSANGRTWETVKGSTQKNSNSSLHTFTDTKPFTGKSYYRIKMTTPDGGVSYTTTQPFALIDHTTLTCFPNPFTSDIQVKGIMAGERVAVTNMYGQCMYLSAPAINNTMTVNINDLQPGVYVISAGNRKMKVEKR